MKKWGRTLLFITAMLCLILLPGFAGFTSHAATGDLQNGYTFNNYLKTFTNSKVVWSTEDKTTKKIVFAKQLGKSAKGLKTKSVGEGITAYYDAKEKTIYICSNAKIYFNKSCSSMFRGFTALETIDFGKDVIDSSRMKDVTNMFTDCSSLKKVNLGALNTQNVFTMQYMFSNCKALETLDLSTFNTSGVSLMSRMFSGCVALKSLDLRSFNTANVTDVQCMFYGCSSLEYVNLSSFNMSKVAEEDAIGFLGGCTNLIYTDAPGVIDRDFGYDDNPGTLANCAIGKCAIDDNGDGLADSADQYSYFISSAVSHRYIFLNAIENAKKTKGSNFTPAMLSGYTTGAGAAPQVNEPAAGGSAAKSGNRVVVDGITYSISAKGKATVIRIGNVKKASINTVKIDGKTYPVTKIAGSACMKNQMITSVTIGSNVKSIGKKAFYGCKKLKKVTIHANKSLKVGKEAFKKLNKKVKISLKGVKGKTRKKIVKSIGVRVR